MGISMSEGTIGNVPVIDDEGHMSPMDYQEHERTFAGFLKLLKFGSIVVVIILAFMAIFLT